MSERDDRMGGGDHMEGTAARGPAGHERGGSREDSAGRVARDDHGEVRAASSAVGAHEPEPGFLNHLEWQLRREIRRRRLESTPVSPGWHRWARTVALVIVGITFGAGAMAASQALEERWRQDLLEARYEVQFEVAEEAVDLQQRVVETARERVRVGTMSSEDLAPHELSLARARAEAREIALHLEEIRFSGGSVGGGVSSPLVAGRDFFTERLQIRLELLRQQQEMLRSELETRERRVGGGTASEFQLQGHEVSLQQVDSRVQALEEQMRIRQAFLDGELSGVQAELRVQQAEADAQERAMRAQLDLARAELDRARTRVEIGTASSIAVAHAELQVSRLEAELELVEMEQTALARRLAEEAAQR